LRRVAFTRRAKFAPNLSHQHLIVSYVTITLRSKSDMLDVAQAQLKAEIPAHGATDDAGWETVPAIERFRFLYRAIVRDRPAHLTMPFEGHERLLAFDRRCLRDTQTSAYRRGM
jgi:hypothetical protein